MKLKELFAYFVIVLFVYLMVRLSSLNFDMDTIISHVNSFKDGIDQANYKKTLNFYDQLFSSEKMTSSTNEPVERVLETIFKSIGQETGGFYVDIRASSAQTSTARYLREKYNWNGLLIDGTIAADMILNLFRKRNVPNEFELFSEKIDNDNYLMIEKMLTKYKPKVIVHQVKQDAASLCGTTTKSSTLDEDSIQLNEESVCGFHCLAKRFDYSMVYCESTGRHCFLIRNDLLRKHLQLNPDVVQLVLSPLFLYEKIGFTFLNRNWHKEKCRRFNE